MPRTKLIGAHLSIAGGLHRAVERADAYGMTALQIFLRSARTWKAPPLSDEAAARFREALRVSPVHVVLAHAGYLVNPASPDRNLRRRSERSLREDLDRCERLGIPWLILHPGSHRGTSARAGVRRAGGVLQRLLAATAGYRAGILVENSAGEGDSIGASFAEWAEILAAAGDGDRLGACLDTCHAYAAGWDLASETGWREGRRRLEETVGADRVRAVHVNDSLHPLGSRRDRHAGIGQGALGRAAFRRLVRDPRLSALPLILETPKGAPGGEDLDARNLAFLRGLFPVRGRGRAGRA